MLPVAGRRGYGQIDRNLAHRHECGSGQHDHAQYVNMPSNRGITLI